METDNIGFSQTIPTMYLDDKNCIAELTKRAARRIGHSIMDVVSDGHEYIVKAMPETRIEKPEICAVEIRHAVSFERLTRCGECIHRKHPADYCDMLRKAYMPDNFFCFYGKREEKENV
ncbi:MAG: hypothetical protein IKE23_01315 [Exiguobacterium sp.]|nr:hypothetical protein [Exiguobacterium sp.]